MPTFASVFLGNANKSPDPERPKLAKAKTPAKKPAAKPKASAAKTTAAKGKGKAKGKSKAAPKKPLTKTQFVTDLAERTSLTKAQVSDVLDKMFAMVVEQVADGNPGKVTIPTLGVQIQLKDVPARPAKEGPVPGRPGETMMYEAKPASRDIKARAMTVLRDTVRK